MTTTRCTGTFLGGRCPHAAPCPLHPAMPTHCSATPVADLQVGDLVVRTLDRHGAVGRVVSIDLDYSDPYAVVQFDDGNWSGARLAWTRVSNGTPPTFDPYCQAHDDDLRLGCAAVTLALLLNLGTINAPGYPYWLRITTHTYGELVSQPDIWEHESAGTMVGGYWGPYRIFANVPLSAIDAYLVRKEN